MSTPFDLLLLVEAAAAGSHDATGALESAEKAMNEADELAWAALDAAEEA